MENHLEIRTHFSKPHPEKKGYVVLDRYCSVQEILDQFKAVLHSIPTEHDCSALEAAEYVHASKRENLKQLISGGELIPIAKPGRCEGTLLQLLLLNESGEYELIITAKYLCDDVWSFLKPVSDACYLGQFN